MLFGINSFANNMAGLASVLMGDDEVMGIETLNNDQIAALSATIAGLGAPLGAKKKAYKKIANAQTSRVASAESTALTDKAQFVNLMWQLPAQVQQAVRDNRLQLVPFTYYGCKEITGQNHVNVFDNGDFTIKGLTNLVQGRMPADEYFCASVVKVLYAKYSTSEAGSDTVEKLIQRADWVKPCSYITNGEWMFGQASITYMDKSASSVFSHDGNHNLADGEYILPTKKMFVPQTDLKAEFDFIGALPTGADRAFIRFEMSGVKTAKA